MKRLLLLIIVAVAAVQAFGKRDAAAPVAVADRSEIIEIYTTSFCGECKRAKAWLDRRDIDYVERDVERDIDLRREFYARGGKGTPLIFVYGERMDGFDSRRFEQLYARRSS